MKSPLLAALLALAAGVAAAQTAPMMKPSQVTENAIADALEIEAPQVDANGQTRSIRPMLKPGEKPKPAGPGKANLLITFATGSSDLTPETMQTLQVVAKALQSDRLAGFQFRVEGHADPRGGDDYNQKLSEERAKAVVSYLTGKLGVLPDRLSSVGKGSQEPANSKNPEALENRRVTIVTVH